MAKKIRAARVAAKTATCSTCTRYRRLRDQAEEANLELKNRIGELEGDLKVQKLATRNAQAEVVAMQGELASARADLVTAREDTVRSRQMGLPPDA